MVAALRGHSAYAKMTVAGQAVDRHLTGLKLVAKENGMELPELYEDPAYTRSVYHRISSSQVSGEHAALTCFGPLVMDGYGLCYNIREHDLLVNISCFHSCPETSSDKFAQALTDAFTDMHDLFLAAKQNSKL